MPLADFVRYLNAQHPLNFSGDTSSPPFAYEGGKVHAYYAGLHLESAFRPVLGVAENQLWGHSAHLRVSRTTTHMPLKPEVLFAMPKDNSEFVYLDRLIRTLHVLNYLTYLDWRSRKTLLLRVHPRHVASVSADHGLAFESILRSCGLMPKQVVLAFEVPSNADRERLLQAFENYRGRGYSIAITRPSTDIIGSGFLAQIDPEIAIIDWRDPDAAGSVRKLQRLGAVVLATASDDKQTRESVSGAGVDLLQLIVDPPKLKHAERSDGRFSRPVLQTAGAT